MSLTIPEKINTHPTTMRVNITAADNHLLQGVVVGGAVILSDEVCCELLFGILNSDETKQGIIYHIHVVGIYTFRYECYALIILYLLCTMYFR